MAEGWSNDLIMLLEVFLEWTFSRKSPFKNRHYAIICSLGFWGSRTAAWPTMVYNYFSKKKKRRRKKGYVHLLAFCGWCLLAELVFCGVTENTVGAFSEKVRRKRRGCDWSWLEGGRGDVSELSFGSRDSESCAQAPFTCRTAWGCFISTLSQMRMMLLQSLWRKPPQKKSHYWAAKCIKAMLLYLHLARCH